MIEVKELWRAPTSCNKVFRQRSQQHLYLNGLSSLVTISIPHEMILLEKADPEGLMELKHLET